jgi:hypothetical protein
MVAKKSSTTKKATSFWVIGKLYIIFTVTRYVVGELVSINDTWITLRDSAWVADTGRFNESLRTGKCVEIEPAPNGLTVVGVGSVVDAYLWTHEPLRMVI